jgi:hypothetical protein
LAPATPGAPSPSPRSGAWRKYGAGAFGHIAGSSGDTRNTGDVGIRFEIALKDEITLKEMIQISNDVAFFLWAAHTRRSRSKVPKSLRQAPIGVARHTAQEAEELHRQAPEWALLEDARRIERISRAGQCTQPKTKLVSANNSGD